MPHTPFDIEHFGGTPEQVSLRLGQVTPAEVQLSLAKPRLDSIDLLHLLSPAAGQFLEPMAQRARQATTARFGKTMKLYAPLYLSNECSNACVYCGFNRKHAIARRTLSLAEVREQAEYLSNEGFQSLLLVSGESRQHVPLAFMADCVRMLKPLFPEISIEVYPLPSEEYRQLAAEGLYGMALYQETYWPEVYRVMHPSGMKRDYAFRLETPERAAAEGLRQVSLGVLLGLTDFRVDAYYLGQHAAYLQKKYWKTLIGLSFPRIRQAAGDFQVPSPVSDPQFVQLVTALRLFLPDAPFSLSTRETAELRNHLLPLGFTQISAGSSTEPGGYPLRKREIAPGISPNKEGFDPLVDVSHPNVSSGAQFHVEDQRSPKEISELLVRQGFEPVWKDWEVF